MSQTAGLFKGMKRLDSPEPAPDTDTLPGQQSFEADYPETVPAPAENIPKSKKAAPDPEPAKKEKGKLASFYLMPDDYKRYQALAKATGKTLSRFIGEAVENYAKRQKLTPDQQTMYDIIMKL